MVDPGLFDTVLPNVGSASLILYLAYEIHFGRVGDAIDNFEDRIDRNALANRYLARANPNASAEAIDSLVDHDGDQAPLGDDVVTGPRENGQYGDRWHDRTRTPADGEDEEHE